MRGQASTRSGSSAPSRSRSSARFRRRFLLRATRFAREVFERAVRGEVVGDDERAQPGASEPDERKLRALTLRLIAEPPEFNVLYVYGADGSRDAQRVMTYERNLASIQNPDSQDYLGRAIEAHRTASWATTVEACARVSRLLMSEKGRSRAECEFVCEWRSAVLPGALVSVIGVDGEELGEYRLTDVRIETGGRLGSRVLARCTAVA